MKAGLSTVISEHSRGSMDIVQTLTVTKHSLFWPELATSLPITPLVLTLIDKIYEDIQR